MTKKIKFIGLIPTRLGSTRLFSKPLLKIKDMPMIIHTYKRAKLAKKLDELFICCDHVKISDIAKKYSAKVLMTSKKCRNGTERIGEAINKIKTKYEYIVDIQGDELLINPSHIDQVIEFHKKNKKTDIILPVLKAQNIKTENIVKVIKDKFDNVLYLSRAEIPFQFKKKNTFFFKHLSIISFTKDALKKFNNFKPSSLEKIEGIELLRAIENGLKVKTLVLKGDSFSVDVNQDYIKAKQQMQKDKIFKKYSE